MAEIKSTLEKVLERAATMGKATKAEIESEEYERSGMRLAAEFLRNDLDGLNQALADFPEPQKQAVLKGLIDVLLRNVVLPRDDQQKDLANKAMAGLLQLGGGAGDLKSILGDLKNILGHYLQTKEQTYRQLEAAFSQQVEQLQSAVAQQTGMKTRLSAAQHPKFQEEWQRIQGSLNDQYGRAIEQHKTLLRQRLQMRRG